MSISTLAVLVLTVTITVIDGTDCECDYNVHRNKFYGDQECFTAYYKLNNNLLGYKVYNDTTIGKLTDTFCTGKCGSMLKDILYYEDRANFYDRRVSQTSVVL